MNVSKRQLAALGALLSGGAAVSAFHIAPSAVAPRVARAPSSSALGMADYDDSYPSDSSEDTHFTVEKDESTIDVENKPSTASESVVSSIMDYLPSSLASSGDLSAEDRAAINEVSGRVHSFAIIRTAHISCYLFDHARPFSSSRRSTPRTTRPTAH